MDSKPLNIIVRINWDKIRKGCSHITSFSTFHIWVCMACVFIWCVVWVSVCVYSICMWCVYGWCLVCSCGWVCCVYAWCVVCVYGICMVWVYVVHMLGVCMVCVHGVCVMCVVCVCMVCGVWVWVCVCAMNVWCVVVGVCGVYAWYGCLVCACMMCVWCVYVCGVCIHGVLCVYGVCMVCVWCVAVSTCVCCGCVVCGCGYQYMLSVCMLCVYGTCVACVWCVYKWCGRIESACMVHVWCVWCGCVFCVFMVWCVCMVYVSMVWVYLVCVQGVCMVCVCGVYCVYIMCVCMVCVVYVWCTQGVCVVCVWCTHGVWCVWHVVCGVSVWYMHVVCGVCMVCGIYGVFMVCGGCIWGMNSVWRVWCVACGVCIWCMHGVWCVWCVVCGVWCMCGVHMVCGIYGVCMVCGVYGVWRVVYAWCVAYMMCVLCVVRARVCGARPVCSTRVPVFSLLQHRHRRAPAALLCSAAAHGLGALFRTEDPGCDRREIQRQEEKSEIGRKIRTRKPLAQTRPLLSAPGQRQEQCLECSQPNLGAPPPPPSRVTAASASSRSTTGTGRRAQWQLWGLPAGSGLTWPGTWARTAALSSGPHRMGQGSRWGVVWAPSQGSDCPDPECPWRQHLPPRPLDRPCARTATPQGRRPSLVLLLLPCSCLLHGCSRSHTVSYAFFSLLVPWWINTCTHWSDGRNVLCITGRLRGRHTPHRPQAPARPAQKPPEISLLGQRPSQAFPLQETVGREDQ